MPHRCWRMACCEWLLNMLPSCASSRCAAAVAIFIFFFILATSSIFFVKYLLPCIRIRVSGHTMRRAFALQLNRDISATCSHAKSTCFCVVSSTVSTASTASTVRVHPTLKIIYFRQLQRWGESGLFCHRARNVRAFVCTDDLLWRCDTTPLNIKCSFNTV